MANAVQIEVGGVVYPVKDTTARQDVSDLKGEVAKTFSSSDNYTPGEAVFYNGALYKFLRPHAAGDWVADDVFPTTAEEIGTYTDRTLIAVGNAALKNRTLLPCIFAYGSIAATGSTRPAYKANADKYRICSVTPIVVDAETTFAIADGFRARRYWFNRSTGAWMTFDGSWQTGSITLATDKIYYINIARTTDVTNEVADISEWAQKVFTEANPGQVYVALSASDYSNLLANVDANVVSNVAVSAGWTDTPEGAAGIFWNQQYSSNYNVQRYLRFGNDRRIEHIRIVNRSSHAIYSDWVMTIHEENPRILVVGDSIAKGTRNSNKGFVGDLGLMYINMGVGGATVSSVHSTYTDSIHKWSTADNIPNQLTTYYSKSDADVLEAFGKSKFTPDIVVADGGINDYIQNADLGTLSSAPVTDDTGAAALNRNTLIGALEYLFYQMVKLYPRAQRYFVITHKTYRPTGQYYPTRNNSSGYNQQQMHDAIYSCCQLYGVVPVDVYTQGIMNTIFPQYRTEADTWSSALATDYCDKDGVHPLAYGYSQVYAPILREAIKTATRKT